MDRGGAIIAVEGKRSERKNEFGVQFMIRCTNGYVERLKWFDVVVADPVDDQLRIAAGRRGNGRTGWQLIFALDHMAQHRCTVIGTAEGEDNGVPRSQRSEDRCQCKNEYMSKDGLQHKIKVRKRTETSCTK